MKDLFDWFQLLTERGGPLGYFVNGSKSWLIVKKEEYVARAREIFGDQVNITTEGQRHLGASLGSLDFKRDYCTEKVNSWSEQLKMLADIVKTQPQAAYAAFTKGFLSKLTYLQQP